MAIARAASASASSSGVVVVVERRSRPSQTASPFARATARMMRLRSPPGNAGWHALARASCARVCTAPPPPSIQLAVRVSLACVSLFSPAWRT